jgi:uncharacterized protein YciI
MPYAIITFDKPGSAAVRGDNRDRHLAYLKQNQHRLLAAGAMLHDDGGTGEGGVILLDTDVRDEAEAFIAADPYTQAALFEKVIVTRWRKAFFDGRFLL